MQAKNKKNAKAFNKALYYNDKYNHYNDLRNSVEEGTKEYKKYDKLCSKHFDSFLTWCDELPKYEVKRIEESEYK